jgi:hypothetical protein
MNKMCKSSGEKVKKRKKCLFFQNFNAEYFDDVTLCPHGSKARRNEAQRAIARYCASLFVMNS